LQVQAPPESFIASSHAPGGAAGDMAAAHGSFTMQMADGQHQQHNGFEQPASMSYEEQNGSLTNEQLAAAYAASQAGFDPQAGFDSSGLGHHQIHPGKSQHKGMYSLICTPSTQGLVAFASLVKCPSYPKSGEQ